MIRSKEQIQDMLEGELPDFKSWTLDAMNEINRINDISFAPFGVLEPQVKTLANLMQEFFMAKAIEKYGSKANVTAKYFEGVKMYGVLFNGKVFIRFNKMNDDLSISGIKTSQKEAYFNQYPLEGLPDGITNLNLGYRVDQYWRNITGIHLVCWKNSSQCAWDIDLLYDQDFEQLTLSTESEKAFDPTEQFKPKTSKVEKLTISK